MKKLSIARKCLKTNLILLGFSLRVHKYTSQDYQIYRKTCFNGLIIIYMYIYDTKVSIVKRITNLPGKGNQSITKLEYSEVLLIINKLLIKYDFSR